MRAIFAAGLVLAAAVLEGAGILLLVPFLELFSGAARSGLATMAADAMGWLGLNSPKTQLLAALFLFLGLLVVRGVVTWARDVSLTSLSIGFVDHWRCRIFRALAGASWSAVSGLKQTDVEHTLNNDVMRIAQGTNHILRGGASFAVLAIQLIVALMLSPFLTALVLGFVAVATVLLMPLQRKARALGEKLTVTGRDVHGLLGQFLSGLKLAKTHGAEHMYVDQFEIRLRDVREQLTGFTREQATARLIFQWLSGLMACVVIFVGIFIVATPVPVLIVILLILTRLSGPFLAMQQGVQSFTNMMPAFESVQAMEMQLVTVARSSMQAPMLGARECHAQTMSQHLIEFHDVSFKYAGQQGNVLAGVSLKIDAGELVALVGSSGAGKTTLVDILVGLLPPSSGMVTIDGVPLTGSTLENWRRDIAYVPQDPFLFNQTIRDNLIWARPTVSDAEIWQALKLAGADKFVRALENDLGFMVGDRGQLLSGGERQRICLARGLLLAPKLLILDEATNAVDLELERQLLETLVSLRQQMTILIITHRHSSLEKIDRVFVLENGQVSDNARDMSINANRRSTILSTTAI
jgi:ATP-binding cassette subfamily C protein